MSPFTVFDPAHKIKQLFWIFRRSSRRQKTFQRADPVEPPSAELKCKQDRHDTSLNEPAMFAVDTAAVCVWDDVYCSNGDDNDEEGEYYILRAQNTLFKVRRSILARDDSAFQSLESFRCSWKYGHSPVIRVPESADKLRDLLWALHHLDPHNPYLAHGPSIFFLLNIVELSSKYRFPSFESWAADQLYKMLQGTALPFSLVLTSSSRSTSSSSMTLTENLSEPLNMDSICIRLLDISFTSRFESLFPLVIRKIVTRTLWYGYHPGETLVRTIQGLSVRRSRFKPHLRHLLGVVYYRMLIDLPCFSTSGGGVIFPRSMDIELRMCFLSAHDSLTRMWARMRSSLSPIGGPESVFPNPHAGCKEMWDYYWTESARRAEQSSSGRRRNPTDVLGLLKSTMIMVRKVVADSPSVCLECSLAGLEAVDRVRDGIINNLSDLFAYC
ncbi:uncharacterized protein BT62DRAFT_932691 [Guyanagaster necrorhizus]|uniref:BTB domain-containing protein n=1 Tax=Guyanagaster necrorhizus TaxID=856835 RepID=A0A9P8AT65_9AGAR|nr:uncharacterized protein BT62DRAFT_932691 [Guyanagaster necrorhizus MCA 3950]KAG7445567.1 hypothetical protein BT62DRAFT_932691 [Guyanagaster necrorhizus MCA 3950]